ncbi:hypothetical protein L2D08_23130 [Domibacillus sp. PGB-M46]|uniref:hypothetical protein n=1 Tax=Domibacillus sp. PGB-M46 TaxID=2910255 RepID=UPI001F591485|nr:hypothetical protein [Domibacillus sp. PGB-M46]MCI2257209.1 hypothetical protein [Domibacillus sp. PGB-M46]
MYKHSALNGQINVSETNFKYVPARPAQAVAALKDGILNGKSDVCFGAENNTIRDEAAILLFNLFGEEPLGGAFGNDASSKFTFVTVRYAAPVNLLAYFPKNSSFKYKNTTRIKSKRRLSI